MSSLHSIAEDLGTASAGLHRVAELSQDPTKIPAVRAAKNVYDNPMDNLLPGVDDVTNRRANMCPAMYSMCDSLTNEADKAKCMDAYYKQCQYK